MIDRYTTEKFKNIWNLENKFNKFLQVEIASCHALSILKIIPTEDYQRIKENARVDVDRILELEKITKHDVIAFTRCVDENLGDEKRFFHYGLTSTDVVDSSNALLLKEANEIIEKDIVDFLAVLKEKAFMYKDTPCIGRTHGIHAEVTSFGLKWVSWYDELNRIFKMFKEARKNVEVIKLSGAVGNFTIIPVEVEEIVSKELELDYAGISTQVLSRDRISLYISILALIASLIEKIAFEVRNLSRTEVREVEEFFSDGQKGSSAMPHKRNPIASENMCGLSRIVRSYVNVAYENNILWHERDISHSSSERIMLADATTLIDYMLTRYNRVLTNLVVFEKRMYKNIFMTNGLVFSSRVLEKLINLGLPREKSYDMVQKAAFISNKEEKNFKNVLKQSEIIEHLNSEEIDDCFNVQYYLRNIDKIYKREFEDYE